MVCISIYKFLQKCKIKCSIMTFKQKIWFSLLFFLTPFAVSGLYYNLTHERVGNEFYLMCHIQNSSVSPEIVQFWINATEKIDILRRAKRVSLKFNIISFLLVPQYEGMFYCGEIDGEQSNGLGPFASKIDAYIASLLYIIYRAVQ